MNINKENVEIEMSNVHQGSDDEDSTSSESPVLPSRSKLHQELTEKAQVMMRSRQAALYVDSSNISSYMKINRISQDLVLGPRKSKERSGSIPANPPPTDADEKQEEPLRKTTTIVSPFSSKKSSTSSSKKLSLLSEENDLVMVSLGDAIRSGDVKQVLEIISNNDISIFFRSGLTFGATFRKTGKPAPYPKIMDDPEDSMGHKDSLKLTRQKLLKQDRMNVTPFHLAILAQQTKIVQCILEMVLNHSSIETIRKLLGAKTVVSFALDDPKQYLSEDASMDGNNAFHLAARFHCMSLLVMIRSLRDHDILDRVTDLLAAKDPHLEMNSLLMAAMNPNAKATTILLSCGLDIESSDSRGYTALHIACKEGREATCKVLLEHGANVNACGDNKHFRTPMHRTRTKRIVSLLLRYGANPFIRQIAQKNNMSALALLLRRHPQAAEEILNNGVETNGQDLDSGDLQIIYNYEVFFREGLNDNYRDWAVSSK